MTAFLCRHSCRTFILLTVFVHAATSAANAQSPRTVAVALSTVVEREVTDRKTFVGTVGPSKRAVLGTAVDGRVIEVLFEEGQRVVAGQPLVKLRTHTVKLELEAAQAELEFRQQRLAKLENGTRPGEIRRSKAGMVAAEARMKHLQAERVRIETLYQSDALSAANRDEAASLAVAAEYEFQEAKETYDLAVAGARTEVIAQARAQLRQQQALVDNLVDLVGKHTIASYFDGYVTLKKTEVGQWVTKGDTVVEVAALDTVDIIAQVPEKDVAHLKVGSEAQVDAPSLQGDTFSGRVALVVPQADIQSRTFPVRVRVGNRTTGNSPMLKSGMHARVTLLTGRPVRSLLVPKDALVLDGDATKVFVVDAVATGKPTARSVPVKLGFSSGQWIQITGELKPGQQIVVRGNERLQTGQHVIVSSEVTPSFDLVALP